MLSGHKGNPTQWRQTQTLSEKHEPKHFWPIENRACSDMLTLCYRAGWKRSWCHLQYVCYTLTITSNHSQLKLEWLGKELRNVLFRGRWSGGKKAGKTRRFCFRLREAVEAPLHCGQSGQHHTAGKAADKNDSKYNFSTYPVFQRASRLSTWV